MFYTFLPTNKIIRKYKFGFWNIVSHSILQHLNENISLTLIQNVNHFYLHLNLRIRYPYNLWLGFIRSSGFNVKSPFSLHKQVSLFSLAKKEFIFSRKPRVRFQVERFAWLIVFENRHNKDIHNSIKYFLISNSKELENRQTLSDYNLQTEPTRYFIIRNRFTSR